MTLRDFAILSGILCVATAALYVIAIITPKLANYIDKLRGKSPDPYGGVPNPARVEDDENSDPTPAEASGENQENIDNGDI